MIDTFIYNIYLFYFILFILFFYFIYFILDINDKKNYIIIFLIYTKIFRLQQHNKIP